MAEVQRTEAQAQVATIDVDRFDDTAAASACTAAPGDCSLRGAMAFADANPATTVNVPAGTYPLTVGELSVGSATNTITTIVGAGRVDDDCDGCAGGPESSTSIRSSLTT